MREPQDFEREWWGDCANTYGEETKQLFYARQMGLVMSHDNVHSPFGFDVRGKKILDIGGGPVSLLLKCRNLAKGSKVVDPCEYPYWVKLRYASAGIDYQRMPAEKINEEGYDEVWIYNVLQHVEDPELIIKNALKAGKVLRIFEWVDIPPHEGHPHMLTEEKLNEWIGKAGACRLSTGESECYGKYYTNVR